MKAVLSIVLLALLATTAYSRTLSQAKNVRDSAYEGPKGSGASFKAAKIGLLDQYAKAKNAPYKVVSEKLGDNTYSVTYSFATPEILADFQAWQYKQAAFTEKLEKFSKKTKGVGGNGK